MGKEKALNDQMLSVYGSSSSAADRRQPREYHGMMSHEAKESRLSQHCPEFLAFEKNHMVFVLSS